MLRFKECHKCGNELPITNEYFTMQIGCKDGFRGICKTCDAKRKKRYYEVSKEANKEAVAKYHKQYAITNKEYLSNHAKRYYLENKNACDKRNKAYYEANKEARSEYHKRHNLENKEYITKRAKRYHQAHLEEWKIKGQRRRAMEKALPSTLTHIQWNATKLHFNNKCAYCGEDKKLTIEHFVPVSKLGELSVENILPVCSRCNSSKGGRVFSAWFKKQEFYCKKRERIILSYLGYKNNIQQLALM